jgi:hypothetical protein
MTGQRNAWCRHEGEGECFDHFEQSLEMVRAGSVADHFVDSNNMVF